MAEYGSEPREVTTNAGPQAVSGVDHDKVWDGDKVAAKEDEDIRLETVMRRSAQGAADSTGSDVDDFLTTEQRQADDKGVTPDGVAPKRTAKKAAAKES